MYMEKCIDSTKSYNEMMWCIDMIKMHWQKYWTTHIEWLRLSAGVQFTEDTRRKQGSSDSRAEDEEKPYVSVTHTVLDTHGVQDRDRQLTQSSSHGARTFDEGG